MQARKTKFGKHFAIVILTLCVVIFSSENCRQKVVFLSSNDYGEIDILGFIENGEIHPDSVLRIQGRDAVIVTQAFVVEYRRLKKIVDNLEE